MANRAEWQERVSEWRASGQSSDAFCAGKGFSAGGLRHSAHRFGLTPAPSAKKLGPRIVRVVRGLAAAPTPAPRAAEQLAVTAPPARVARAASEPVVLECGALRVAVRAGFDRETLGAVLDLMLARAGAR